MKSRHSAIIVFVFTALSIVLASGMRAEAAREPLSVEETRDWQRYQVILDRAPFGHMPKPGDADYVDPNVPAAQQTPEEQGPALADVVKVTMITIYEGKPAVGFVDNATKKSYWLREGETADGYSIVSVAPLNATAVIGKDGQTANLKLGGGVADPDLPAAAADGGAGPSEKPAALGATSAVSAASVRPVAAAANDGLPPGVTFARASGQKSYSDIQREREEARRKAEAAKKAEEEKMLQERLSNEVMKKQLREMELRRIKAGEAPSKPIELTPEEARDLANEGYDLTGGGAEPK